MSIRQKISLTTVGAVLITLSTVVPAAASSFYSITDLGTLPGSSFSIATDINDFGQVVGYSANDYTSSGAFFWENGVMTDLGTLGGSYSAAWGINNSGQVVGWAQTGEVIYDGSPVVHAFLWSQNVEMTDLTPTIDSFFGSRAKEINDAGQVLVSTNTSDGTFLLQNGVRTQLCQVDQCAYDLNNSGHVVGRMYVVWENGERIELGTIWGAERLSYAYAINDAGQIVGESDLHAVLWENRMLTDLGTLGGRLSNPVDINNLGQVVGWSDTSSPDSEVHAFLWDSTNGMQDLNSLIPANSGWLLSEARAINEAEQIVGYGTINGQQHAFLLTPDPERQSVPEPASALGLLALIACGAGSQLLRLQKSASGTTSKAS